MLSNKDKKGIVIIGVCAFFFVGLGGLAIYIQSTKVEIDEHTLCPTKDLPSGHTALLVDRTDPLAKKQTEWLFLKINQIKTNLAVHEKLSIVPITKGSGKFLNPIFSLCSPRQGTNVNPWYESQRLLQKKFNEQFGLPLKKVLGALRKGENYDQSPIMETIQRLSERNDFSPALNRRQLIIASDMLQNAGHISHYKKYSSDFFFKSDYFNQIKANLNNADVKIYYFASSSPKALRNQGERHKKFWRDFFARSNVDRYSLVPVSEMDLKEATPIAPKPSRKPAIPNTTGVKKNEKLISPHQFQNSRTTSREWL